jgi:hypothetical protein
MRRLAPLVACLACLACAAFAACASHTTEAESGATGTGASGTSSASTGSGSTTSGGSVTGITGGTLDTLSFAIVGDTRPPNEDDVAGYPTAIITKIWQDVQAASPRPAFAVATGDYQYSNPTGSQAVPQLEAYLGARAAFSGVSFPAMGNHECTGGTTSNCGVGNTDGITANYSAFMSKMLAPLGVSLPYYVANVASTPGAASTWTAKFVVVAANAWDTAQATWLDATLAKPTTYTFIVRHESSTTNPGPPGVAGSETILAKYPYTLKIIGHSHEYRYEPNLREVIVGNGGAPLSGGSNYGYVLAQQRATDGAIVFTSYEYDTNAVVETFALTAAGSAAP